MAKLPRTGVAYQSLDEREVSLADIINNLGLKPLSKKARGEIRHRLGFALATWDEPYGAIQIKDVTNSLTAHAKRLDQLASLGSISRSGLVRKHDIAVGGSLVQVLATNPSIGSIEAAHEYLRNFCISVDMMASSCRAAVANLRSNRGKGGKTVYRWYDEFTAVLLYICERNKIEPTIGLDSISGEAVGTLAKIALAFEQLLPPTMRSRKPATMVKRLQRSLGRLKPGQAAISARKA
jgi:hypothetical protein